MKTFIFSFALWVLAGTSWAASKKATAPQDNRQEHIPNLEDHANYYNPSQTELTPSELKRADDLRLKTIASIKALLEEKKKINEFELLLRLGELYAERHDYLRDLELDEYTKAYDIWKAADPKKRGSEPKLTYKKSTAELHLAVSSLRKLVSKYPKHPRTDSALYALAKTMARLDDNGAFNYYEQLIKQHPKSPLIPDAYLALGELYFEKNRVPEAIKSYQEVMKFKEHRAYPYALYKLGWAYYNSNGVREKKSGENLQKAIAAFKLVVKISDKNRSASQRFDLREEALKDLVMTWAETEEIDAAWKYFNGIKESEKFYGLLEKLGHAYADQGKHEQAIKVFERLLTEAPLRPRSLENQLKLVELYDLSGQNKKLADSLEKATTLYIGDTEWARANAKDKNLVANAAPATEKAVHRWGAIYHSRGQKAKNNQLLLVAARLYEIYLKNFSQGPAAYEIRYYLADIMFDTARYEGAAKNYMVVAKSNTKDGKYFKISALNAVASMAKLVETSKFSALPPAGKIPSPMTIPQAKKAYVDTIDQYLALLPKEKEAQAMRFTAAQIYFDYGHYEESLKRHNELITLVPVSQQAQASAKIIVAFYGTKSDWENVIKEGRKLLANQLLVSHGPTKAYLEDMMRKSLFQNALAYEKAQEYNKAALTFLEFQKMFPKDANGDRALYNASVNYFRIAEVEQGMQALQKLISDYPKSKLMADALAQVAETQEAMAQFDKAARSYQQFAHTFPADSRSPNALYNSAVLYRGLGKMPEAGKLFTEVTRRYPNHSLASSGIAEAAQLKERQADLVGALEDYKHLASYAEKKDRDQYLFACAKVAALQMTLSPSDKNAREVGKIATLLKDPKTASAYDARRIIAETLFKLEEPSINSFKALRLNGNGSIEKQVVAKQGRLERLAKSYERIMNLQSPEYTVASLYRLGELHEDFAKALFEAPAPQGMSQAEANKFRSDLEQVAFPLKAEALKFYEAAAKQSTEGETFTAWTRLSYDKMAELAPEKNPSVNEQSASVSYLMHRMALSSETSGIGQ